MALPLGWTRVYLSDICVPRKEKVLPAESLLRVFIGLEQVQAHTMKLLNTVDSSQIKSSAQKFYMNDILYGRLRPYLSKVIVTDIDGICSSEFIVLPQQQCLDSNYLAYHLNSTRFVAFASSKVTGDRPRIDFDAIGDYELLFPPLAEQHRIVAKIDAMFSELDKGVDVLQTVRQQLRTYRQAVLKWAFEGFLMKTPRKLISKICSHIVDCPHSTPKWTAFGKLCLRTTNFRKGYLDLSEKNFVSDDTFNERIQRLRPAQGDVLYSREGAILGLACLVPPNTELCLGQRMMLMRTDSQVLPRYLMHYLNSPYIEVIVKKKTGGTASPHLNVGDVKFFELPVPPVTIQTEVIATIESRLSVCDKLKQIVDENLAKAHALRQSILKRAFAGKLVPQDPNDEPAEKLLERIREAKATAATQTISTRRKKK